MVSRHWREETRAQIFILEHKYKLNAILSHPFILTVFWFWKGRLLIVKNFKMYKKYKMEKSPIISSQKGCQTDFDTFLRSQSQVLQKDKRSSRQPFDFQVRVVFSGWVCAESTESSASKFTACSSRIFCPNHSAFWIEAHREQTYGHWVREREGGTNGERSTDIYTLLYAAGLVEVAMSSKELQLGTLWWLRWVGCGGGGWPKSGDMCTQTADSVCEQYEKAKRHGTEI